jgi:hypothetical protein
MMMRSKEEDLLTQVIDHLVAVINRQEARKEYQMGIRAKVMQQQTAIHRQ